MADSTSPKGGSGDFAKKVQKQLSRGKEKVQNSTNWSSDTDINKKESQKIQIKIFFNPGDAKAGEVTGD